MTNRLVKNLLRLYDLLPRDLDARADLCLMVTFPVILLKALRKTFFPPDRNNGDSGRKSAAERVPSFLRGTDEGEIAIRYSGGDDSTLVAALAAERFRKVHLLTFTSNSRLDLFGFINSDPLNTNVNALNLAAKYGKDKFRHEILNIGELRSKIYFNDFEPACGNDRFLKSCFCIPCTLAMHIETIIYCLRNGVRFASDGSNAESGVLYWQTQNPFNLREIVQFYARFGITYVINPAYQAVDSGAELNRLGVHKVGGSKTDYRHRRKTQQFCHLIQIQTVCRRLSGTPRDGDTLTEGTAGLLSRFFADKLGGYEALIRAKLQEEAPQSDLERATP